jgi:crossover junction endodeoxyribonuclease RuvC
MYYLGLDISLRKSGWGLVEKKNNKITYLASGIIVTKAQKIQKGYHSDSEALLELYQNLIAIFEQYQPNYCAIENSYVNLNPLSSLKLAQARAMGILVAAKFGLLPKEYQASSIKKIVTGKGNSDKEAVYRLIKLQLGPLAVESYDESDAIAIAFSYSLEK